MLHPDHQLEKNPYHLRLQEAHLRLGSADVQRYLPDHRQGMLVRLRCKMSSWWTRISGRLARENARLSALQKSQGYVPSEGGC